MGVVNLTPDSFSGDGLGNRPENALALAIAFESQGADIIDLGAESTRPGHVSITVEEELSRLLPALEKIVARVNLPVSVDTYKVEVARQALTHGAWMINDVWGTRVGEGMAGVAAEQGVPIVLMHNQTTTEYLDLVPDVTDSLKRAAEQAMKAGVLSERIILDPVSASARRRTRTWRSLGALGN